MFPTFLTNRALRLILFGGKGGVGKTTTAAASAILIAERHPEKKILLISTDPAHSLGDSFEIKLGDDPVPADPYKNIFLREFNAAKALDRFKTKHGKAIKLIADRGTYFDGEDINRFFDLSFPGIDEVMGILEIAELTAQYDTVIIDTAPTGHTLSMLKLPAVLKKWMEVFSLMGEKHHILEEHFARSRSHDEADSFIETINAKLTHANSLLCNASETEFVVVTIPEEMVLDETERLLRGLFTLKIPVRTLVINRVYEGKGCPYCERRADQQRPFIDILEQKPSYKKNSIPLFPSEIKGVAKLKMFASALTGVGGTVADIAPKKSAVREYKDRLPLKDIDKAALIMIGGKGGVGKTTTSAATALLLAGKYTDRTYNLYSIDPAHSLGCSFGKAIGEKGLQVLPNLHVFELDADDLYLKFQEEYRSAIDDLFDQFAGGASYERGMDLGHDRELLNALFEMSPPGLNELMALHKIISDMEKADSSVPPKADCVIFDTAPTGHFVRFMEMPALVRSWLNATFELLLKYKGVVRLGEIAEKLINLSKNIRSVIDMMTDNKKTAAIVVTIPKAIAVAESERLLESLDGFKIKCDGIVVNMVTHAGDCGLCAAYAADEACWMDKAKHLRKNAAVVPYLTDDMCGVQNLKKFGELVWK